MRKQMVGLIGILTLCAVPRGWAQQLGVGDPAPGITVKEWVKGAPVARLEKGKPYVVEFWATWCGPCRVSIPHLTELHKKHPGITFIGVSVWEQDQKGVKPFVQQMGDKMAYTVAMDDVPAGGTGNDGKMAKAWMQAAGQDGIPTAFLVDRESKIAWIGHPMALDEPLTKLAAGTWDTATARTQFQKDQTEQRKMADLEQKLTKAQQSGDPHQVLDVLDQAIAQDPALEANVGVGRFMLLSRQIKDPAKALPYGSHLVDGVLKDNPQGLNQIAWLIVAPDAPKPDAPMVQLAVKAAQRADELTQGKNPGIADTLARAYFAAGSPAKALETQQRAVKLAQGASAEAVQDLKSRLEEYRKAAQAH
jgi:thiol-disulfide isomerase/thioredoxin